MKFLIFLLFIASGCFLLFCKWEYDNQESLVELEDKLRAGDWGIANLITGKLIAIIIYRYCKKIPCVSPRLRIESPVGKFLYNVTNKRQEKSCIKISLGTGGSSHVSTEEIEKFPMNKLQAIDNLWTKYSQGKFGFSVQASIYKKYGKTSSVSIRDDEFTLNDFQDERWTLSTGTKLNPSQVKLWSRIDFIDYIKKHEKDLFLKLNWIYQAYEGHDPPVGFYPPGHDFPHVEGIFPHFYCPDVSFLLWRKILRGSVID